jgi:hypothetical protein
MEAQHSSQTGSSVYSTPEHVNPSDYPDWSQVEDDSIIAPPPPRKHTLLWYQQFNQHHQERSSASSSAPAPFIDPEEQAAYVYAEDMIPNDVDEQSMYPPEQRHSLDSEHTNP